MRHAAPLANTLSSAAQMEVERWRFSEENASVVVCKITCAQPTAPTAVTSRTLCTTDAICASDNYGNIGSEINSKASSSDTGRLPGL